MNSRLQDFLNELFEGKDYSWILDKKTKTMYFNPKEVLSDCGYTERAIEDKVAQIPSEHKRLFTNNDLIQPTVLNVGLKIASNFGQNWVTVYALIDMLQGRKKKATEIKNWLIYEVLPSIDKNGYYIDNNITSEQVIRLEGEVEKLKADILNERTKRAYGSTEIVRYINVPNLLSSSLLRYLAEIGLGTYEVAKKNRVFKPNDRFIENFVADERSMARLSVGDGIIFFKSFALAINNAPHVLKRLYEINQEELAIKQKGIDNRLPF